jgi:hypothetical protein
MYCADHSLLLPIVADGLTRRADAACQCRIRHDAPAPHMADQIVFCDKAARILGEVVQQFQNLGLDSARLTLAPQDKRRGVNLAVADRDP